MNIEVKKQHYVWEFYLKAWGKNDQIWCRRAGKIFQSSTENVAQERYFYEIEPLTPVEVKLLNRLVLSGPAINQIVNLSSLETYIMIANSKDNLPRFGLELYHSMIEGKAVAVMAELRKGNSNILNDKKSKIDLCIYLGHQYTRTKKVKNSFSSEFDCSTIPVEYLGCDLNKIHYAMTFVYAGAIGSSICDHLDLRIVRNESKIKLLTNDQPIYNFLAVPGTISKEASFYFPLAPELALWAKKGPNDEKIESEVRAKELNSFMVRNSHESIFASSKEELENLGQSLN